jgi:cell division protein FtsB|tara:strand:+ start:327 stop:554 length:228 start_codon:yes stop_codon:yes gene_type:complete
VDIKVITGAVGLVITIGGLFIFQGQLIQRIDVLESQKAVNIKPLEQQIAVNKAEIAVLNAVISEMKARSDNPLGQ